MDRLSIWLREHRVPISVVRFGSMFRIYTQENMLFFVSVAHSDNDLLALEEAVKDSVRAMRQGGYLA